MEGDFEFDLLGCKYVARRNPFGGSTVFAANIHGEHGFEHHICNFPGPVEHAPAAVAGHKAGYVEGIGIGGDRKINELKRILQL